MKKSSIAILILFFVAFQIYGQTSINSLMSSDIKETYRNGTRSITGLPGPNYWQNRSFYDIQAELLASESKLSGSEKITYFNNSPDSLTTIVIRLYQDLYKKGNKRDWPINASDLHNGMQIDYLRINGYEIELADANQVNRTPTNLIVNLPHPIYSADSAIIECKWSFHIPESRQVRMGNYGQNNFFIAYWYPQVAVYDDIDGWDKNEYTGTVEFYNDINDYKVNLTTPGTYLVWASGELKNGNDLFNDQVLERIQNAGQSDEVVQITSIDDLKNNKVLQNKNGNTWHFEARKIPDFTFAAATEVNWEATSVLVDSVTGRRVFINSVFPDSVFTFNKVASYAWKSIQYMSEKLPGWPYPYPQMTVFCNANRRGGMESPMMCNNGDSKDGWDEDNLTFHEILHSYFPFYMGTNERKYAWMDEGWAAYLVSGYNDINSPDYDYFRRIVSSFQDFSGKEAEVPPLFLSYQITNYQSYRVHAYSRPALAYAFLCNALGDSLFIEGLHYYMKAWNGKHPIPFDFFNSISQGTGQQLDWFFIPWFFSHSSADLGIKKITTDNQVVIENYGGLPLPVVLQVEFIDGTKETIEKNTSVWSTGEQAIIMKLNSDKKIKKIQLGSKWIPDVDNSNNVLSTEDN